MRVSNRRKASRLAQGLPICLRLPHELAELKRTTEAHGPSRVAILPTHLQETGKETCSTAPRPRGSFHQKRSISSPAFQMDLCWRRLSLIPWWRAVRHGQSHDEHRKIVLLLHAYRGCILWHRLYDVYGGEEQKTRLLHQLWFERLWVRQEVLLETEAHVHCGFRNASKTVLPHHSCIGHLLRIVVSIRCSLTSFELA